MANSLHDYLTPIEQAAVCMETRPVRQAAREKELSQDNKLFSPFNAKEVGPLEGVSYKKLLKTVLKTVLKSLF